MTDINVGQGPLRVFAESAQLRIINGFFYLNFISGEQAYTFVLPPGLAKVMGQGIAQQITEVEEKTGQKFDGGSANGPIVSPWSSPPPGKNSK